MIIFKNTVFSRFQKYATTVLRMSLLTFSNLVSNVWFLSVEYLKGNAYKGNPRTLEELKTALNLQKTFWKQLMRMFENSSNYFAWKWSTFKRCNFPQLSIGKWHTFITICVLIKNCQIKQWYLTDFLQNIHFLCPTLYINNCSVE